MKKVAVMCINRRRRLRPSFQRKKEKKMVDRSTMVSCSWQELTYKKIASNCWDKY